MTSLGTLAARLPDVPTLRAWSQSLAVLDAVLSPEWEYRYFSFDSRWGQGEELASMRNGSGDEYSFTFTPAGVYGRAFDHESQLSPFRRQPPGPWPGLLDAVPEVLRPAVEEPAFTMGDVPNVSLTLWRLTADAAWSHGVAVGAPEGDDGGSFLFEVLDGDPRSYAAYAADYFEVDVDLGAIEHVYAHRPLTEELVRALNPVAGLADLVEDLDEIGYPTG